MRVSHIGWAVVMGTLLSLASAASAAVPGTITQQGRLFDSAGVPATGTIAVVFTLYDSTSSTIPLWRETRNVTFQDGYFAVALGSETAFSPTVFDGSTRFLGIRVGNDPEMTPRASVGSVPYALVAGEVNGDIHPRSVSVGGQLVIDEDGNWLGDPTGLVGPAGPAGPAGPQGPAGPAGERGPVGATGATGVPGPVGLTGATGAQGPQGVQGQPGPVGATGPQGPVGPQGATGPQGPQGASGVVSVQTAVGPTTSITATDAFIGPIVNVAITSTNQRLVVVANQALGTSSPTGASALSFGVCSIIEGGLAYIGRPASNLSIGANQRNVFSWSASIAGLTPGTYQVGACASSASPANWNSNHNGSITAFVTNL